MISADADQDDEAPQQAPDDVGAPSAPVDRSGRVGRGAAASLVRSRRSRIRLHGTSRQVVLPDRVDGEAADPRADVSVYQTWCRTATHGRVGHDLLLDLPGTAASRLASSRLLATAAAASGVDVLVAVQRGVRAALDGRRARQDRVDEVGRVRVVLEPADEADRRLVRRLDRVEERRELLRSTMSTVTPTSARSCWIAWAIGGSGSVVSV